MTFLLLPGIYFLRFIPCDLFPAIYSLISIPCDRSNSIDSQRFLSNCSVGPVDYRQTRLLKFVMWINP